MRAFHGLGARGWRTARRARDALTALAFPHPAFRAGQRELSEGVYRAVVAGRCLVVQAPTGIGKTIATLFPALKAWPGASLDKIFFLTAKGSGRRLALDALDRIGNGLGPGRLRVVELVARAKACEHPDKACHGESCPLARGFYDRLPAARSAALQMSVLDQRGLRRVALDHAVCPYHLGHELVRWADVVVGDYNHYFDLHAMLYGLTLAHEWRVAVLVDEAHNLLERARAMYSAQLQRSAIAAVRRSASPAVAKALDRLTRRWRAIERSQIEPYRTLDAVPADFARRSSRSAARSRTTSPKRLRRRATRCSSFTLQHSTSCASYVRRPFDMRRDHRAGAALLTPRRLVLRIRNVIPAPHLQGRFAGAARQRAVLGNIDAPRVPPRHARAAGWHRVARSRFAVRAGSARRADREHAVDALSGSHRVARRGRRPDGAPVHARAGQLPGVLQQLRLPATGLRGFRANATRMSGVGAGAGMAQADRDAYLARFTDGGCGIGFAVLGGSFGEGIDLPGRRLIGAFVATLGLPPLNPVNDNIRQRMQSTFGAGYAYAYLYPGIQKVVQAVGRVIRSEHDSGVVHLLDDRFDRPEVRRLLPAWWTIAHAAIPERHGRTL